MALILNVGPDGVEPSTSSLSEKRSTGELRTQVKGYFTTFPQE